MDPLIHPKAAHTATGGASGRNPWPLTTACATPPTTGRASRPNAIRPAAPRIRRCAVAVADTPAPYAPWPTACSRSPAPCSDRCCCRSGWRRRRGRPAGATQRRGHDGQVKQGEQEALHARDSVGQTSGATQRGLNPGCSERIANSRRTRSMGRPRKYSPEVRERAVRLVFDHEHQHDSQ